MPDSNLLVRCATRRAEVVRQLAAAGGGVALLPTAPEAMRNRDADYPYRHDSYFYYLTGFTEPHSLLALQVTASGSSRSVLFCRDKDVEREIWDGFRWGPEAAREAFGFDAALSINSLETELPKLLADQPAVWWPFAVHAGLETQVERWLAAVRAQARAGVTAPRTQHDLCAILDDMRLFKDPYELDVIRRASTISAQGHIRAMQASRRGLLQPPSQGLREYHLEAELLHTFRQGGSQAPAYGSIVAAGANACVLHYRASDAPVRAGDLVLIDAACELDGYASDITRTFPADGRFTGPQRALYDVVLAAQSAAIEASVEGARFTDPHDAALRILAQGLLDHGLIARNAAPDVDAVIATGAYKRFYMHRTSHWMGMDVHDCGDYAEPGQAIEIQPDGSRKRPARILREAMVLTIEPGLYVRAADDLPAEFHGIGIRIEDDIAVRADGQPCEVLTAAAPKTVADIEAVMRG
ncbi:MAG: aminopeptidase P N-terminal domain-containing protein [Thiomonas arsenitoxydans]|uniref:Xaa-Pro aminopeptidase n=1 Tax=Thiomonas arsenitoxydans (strain DSM 22701 / CIP 110005 / 3As) TaxID=426114 RepID=A0A8I1SWV1_THIA3|nr:MULTISPECIES: aminopeptidase P N-terminal domain-containing protein [Thiomonas]MBN8743949.1 aminopeptidase P N-terminal domain-containing protein [Thiomonas arsenitoxydans]ODU97871.1 MAG: Xaa-Pro aminopeptidase [Thiomonas sp. SCN 64-16]